MAKILGELGSPAKFSGIEIYLGKDLNREVSGLVFPIEISVRGVTENPHYIITPKTLTTTLSSEGFP